MVPVNWKCESVNECLSIVMSVWSMKNLVESKRNSLVGNAVKQRNTPVTQQVMNGC